MESIRKLSIENIYFRHGLFWLSWVLGFTFVKSFGEGLSVYGAWLVYYIVTLPLFVLHTYLIVYWAGKRFMKGWRISIFILIFVLLLCIFSLFELLISDKFLSVFFPYVFQITEDFYSFSNVLISGVGNLYILLVFVAAKLMRMWFLADDSRKDMLQKSLELDRADANSGIQPGMLLYIVSELEKMSERMQEEVPAAIAQLSELLNEVMMANHQKIHRVDEELALIRKMLKLYGILLHHPVPETMVHGDELHTLNIPAFMLFSPLEMLIRTRKCLPAKEIKIEINKFDDLEAKISWELMKEAPGRGVTTSVYREMRELYGDRFNTEYNITGKRLTVLVRYTV